MISFSDLSVLFIFVLSVVLQRIWLILTFSTSWAISDVTNTERSKHSCAADRLPSSRYSAAFLRYSSLDLQTTTNCDDGDDDVDEAHSLRFLSVSALDGRLEPSKTSIGLILLARIISKYFNVYRTYLESKLAKELRGNILIGWVSQREIHRTCIGGLVNPTVDVDCSSKPTELAQFDRGRGSFQER